MNINELPLITFPPAWTDDDVRFHSDMIYFRALLNDISDLVYVRRTANPFPITLSDELDAATDLLQQVKW
jgi:hypothetical protein